MGTLLPGIGLAVLAIVLMSLAMKCHHRGPLGLLPPMADPSGQRIPPRWYCADCGRSWPANFERQQTPIQRFSGYDESKAVSSARRAVELESAQRVLAVRRAGSDWDRAARIGPRALQASNGAPLIARPERIGRAAVEDAPGAVLAHSLRQITSGSTRDARRAAGRMATALAPPSRSSATAYVAGSNLETPNSSARR